MYKELVPNLLRGNVIEFTMMLKDVLLNVASNKDTGIYKEYAYNILLVGLIVGNICGEFEVQHNRETA